MPRPIVGLRQKQSHFVRCLGMLIHYADLRGYELTLAEGYIGDSIDKPKEDTPHLRQGNHFKRLAQDLNLFVREEWITTQHDAWMDLGVYWERLDPMCRWGGRFGDYGHFSFEHEGVI